MQSQKIPKVVFIDDNAAMLNLLIQAAKAAGFRSRGFHSAEEFIDAQEWLDAVDCLVVDHRLPGMSGEELLTYLVQSQYTAPIILVTGHGDVPAACGP